MAIVVGDSGDMVVDVSGGTIGADSPRNPQVGFSPMDSNAHPSNSSAIGRDLRRPRRHVADGCAASSSPNLRATGPDAVFTIAIGDPLSLSRRRASGPARAHRPPLAAGEHVVIVPLALVADDALHLRITDRRGQL